MKIEIKEEIEVTLILNKTEATWLKEIMQNPFYGQDLENEREADCNMRHIFWNALNNKGIKLTP